MIRPAVIADLPALVSIEQCCFSIDRISLHNFRHLLNKGNAVTLVDDEAGTLRGYVMVRFRRNSTVARIYSLAVVPAWQGKGISKALICAAENTARDRGANSIRLEVRIDNKVAQHLYRSLGYRVFATVNAYYEDRCNAQRFEKRLMPLHPEYMTSSPRHIVVVDRTTDWKWDIEGLQTVTADEYLTQRERPHKRPMRVINLCRRYSYLSAGYYCSLLAEARGDLPMPTVADILDLSRHSLYAFALPELNQSLNKTMQRLAEPPGKSFDLYTFFGQADDPHFKRLGTELFDLFRYPLLKVSVERRKGWEIKSIKPLGLHRVDEALAPFFEQSIRHYTRLPARKRSHRKPALYDLAVLINPNEKLPPSNQGALERFIKAGKALRMDVELITAHDYHRIAEYDALFLRETTALNDHTFRFARKAEAEGLPVIDDSKSILRCTNKVYMWERLNKQKLPTPKTIPLNRTTFDEDALSVVEEQLGYPMVLKIPDGCFSRGMFKVNNREEAKRAAATLFESSRLILAQEFMYTAYDWRIGILNGQPLYACQYKASRGHWQIVNHKADGTMVAGGFRTMDVGDAPQHVVELATKAAGLIGNSLYGVDIKENDAGIYVIEINDNPNIDFGIEDKVLKGELYTTIMQEFIRRIEASRNS